MARTPAGPRDHGGLGTEWLWRFENGMKKDEKGAVFDILSYSFYFFGWLEGGILIFLRGLGLALGLAGIKFMRENHERGLHFSESLSLQRRWTNDGLLSRHMVDRSLLESMMARERVCYTHEHRKRCKSPAKTLYFRAFIPSTHSQKVDCRPTQMIIIYST